MQETTPYYLPTTVKLQKNFIKNKLVLSFQYEDNNINKRNTEDIYDY